MVVLSEAEWPTVGICAVARRDFKLALDTRYIQREHLHADAGGSNYQ
jgi:hypothetical protein